MKNSTRTTALPEPVLTTATWVACLALAVEVYLDILSLKQFVTLIALTAVGLLYQIGRRLAAGAAHRVETALDGHAARMECATREHGRWLRENVLTAEKFFELGVHSDDASRRAAADSHPMFGGDTGPFRTNPDRRAH
jgi:hypothetical protein